jgi:hypothetical protein
VRGVVTVDWGHDDAVARHGRLAAMVLRLPSPMLARMLRDNFEHFADAVGPTVAAARPRV